MNKTKIDWCDSSFNPVTGCRHECKYCYARRMAERFGKMLPDFSLYAADNKGLHILDTRVDKNPYPFLFEPTFHAYRLDEYKDKKGRAVFVCSMADLFGEWIPDWWIEEVFATCKAAKQHVYLFLTKNPKRYIQLNDAGKLPHADNMWYGTSAETMKMFDSALGMLDVLKWKSGGKVHTFVSAEPLMEDISELDWFWNKHSDILDWLIIGAETGNRKGKIIPALSWLKNIERQCHKAGMPLFMKSSLDEIWDGEPIKQLGYKIPQEGK